MAVYIPNIDVEEFYKICKEHGIEIIAVPAADVQPVVRGKWVQVMGKYDWMVKCSRCNGVPLETSNFCPNCGSDMREES